jgi:hypothetical protein
MDMYRDWGIKCVETKKDHQEGGRMGDCEEESVMRNTEPV